MHRARGAVSVFAGRGDVVRVPAGSVAGELAERCGVAAPRVVLGLENQHGSAFADHEAVAVLVERTAGSLRIVVSCGKCARVAEPCQRHRRDRRLAAAGQDDIGISGPQQAQGLAERMCAGGARGHGGEVGSLETELDRDLTRGHVDDHHRDEERADPPWPLLDQVRVLILERLHAADARTQDDPDTLAIDRIQIEPRAADRLGGGHDRELDEAIHALRILAVEHPLGREILDLAGEARAVPGGVESRDRAGARTAGDQPTPELFPVVAERRDNSKAGHQHAMWGGVHCACAAFHDSGRPRCRAFEPGTIATEDSRICTTTPSRASAGNSSRRLPS